MLKAQALSGSEWVCRMVRTTMADWARALLALESGLPDAHGDLGRAQFITSVWHEFLTHPFANIRFFLGRNTSFPSVTLRFLSLTPLTGFFTYWCTPRSACHTESHDLRKFNTFWNAFVCDRGYYCIHAARHLLINLLTRVLRLSFTGGRRVGID